MNERRAALDAFREGDVRFLICTDVAARGIDIKALPYVINLTLPPAEESENYIHRVGRVGRADKMGLAISIVAAEGVNERVSYHTCKDRGKNCNNRKLLDQGGCTTWLDESKALAAIEKRLHAKVPELNADFSLPTEIAALNVNYGEEAKTVGGRENLHLEMLGPTVLQLGKMEVGAQSLFHSLQTEFGRFESSDEAYARQTKAARLV
jgi:ATP-dependent RNA helicase DDX1